MDAQELARESNGKMLCLTICGYRKPGMSEEDYRHHMTKVSAPMTQDLMVKYGVVRWTMVSLAFAQSSTSYPAMEGCMEENQAIRSHPPDI